MVETCEKIKVFSNSWPDPTKTSNEPAVKSDSHRAIATLIQYRQFDPKQLHSRVLTVADQIEIRNLHQEWFPIQYG